MFQDFDHVHSLRSPYEAGKKEDFLKRTFFYATANKMRLKIPLKISSHSSYHSCHAYLMLLHPISEEVSQIYFVGKPTHPHVSYKLDFWGACIIPEMTPYAPSFMEYSIWFPVEMPCFWMRIQQLFDGKTYFFVSKHLLIHETYRYVM